MKHFEHDMNTCKEYSGIMNNIEEALNDNDIEYEKISNNEIMVPNKTKKEVSELIHSLAIPSVVIYLMINIVELKKKIYIRKKIK